MSLQARHMLAKLHANLGPPTNERLARRLNLEGAPTEVIEAAKALRCMLCARVPSDLSPTSVGAPAGAAQRADRPRHILSVDAERRGGRGVSPTVRLLPAISW